MSESLPRAFVLVLCGTMTVFVVAIVLYTQEQISQQTKIIESERLVTVNQIAIRTELRIDNAIKFLQLLSKDQDISSPPTATFIDSKLHGIPENLDTDRRNKMRQLFDTYGGFQNMLFLLPNGDVYINEPFLFQKNLTVSNFAFRDWHKEVVATQDVVVSDVVISKSSGKSNVVIAVPVFAQNGSFQGILTGSLNLDLIQEKLAELKSYSNERIILRDDTRTVIADSEKILKGQRLSLKSGITEKVLGDEKGTIVDTTNNTKMFVAYHPVKVGQSVWSIISLQPYDEAFHSVNATIRESFILTTFIVVLAVGSVYVVNRLFQTQVKIRKQVEDTNASLVKTQTLLSQSEEKFRNLYDISPDAIVVFDTNGIVTLYNEKFKDLFGYSSQEFLGRSVFDIVKDDKLDLAHSYFDELQKTGILENKENWLKRKDGTVFPSLFSCGAMNDHNNSIIGYIAVIKDIGEIYDARKKLEEASDIILKQLNQLEDIGRLKEEFSTMITHELKTPLLPITGYCKMLKNKMLGELNNEQLDSIGIIEKNAKRLEVLISDIMDARKLDIDKMRFHIDEIQLDEFFDALNSNYKPILQQRGQEFITNTIKGTTIKSDKTRLRQVFDNLLSNAIKFIPEKNGRIEVGLQKKDRNLIFYVKDNGIGIPPEAQPNLFKKFYQVDTSERRKAGGTGLGLAISKGIVEKLGGTITVESDGKSGTTFYINFPIE